MCQRPRGIVREVDLPGPHPRHEFVRREIHDFDIIRRVEHRIRNGLAHTDPGDLRHHVVQALDVLDIERCEDIDPGSQDLLDVLVALRMPRTRRIGVRELIDQGEGRAPFEQGFEIHLGKAAALVVDVPPRQHLQTVQERLRLGPAVCLDDGRDHVQAVAQSRMGRGQHLVGLTDPGGSAEEDLQPPPKPPARRVCASRASGEGLVSRRLSGMARCS